MNIMYRVPAIAIGIPTQANSKKPKGLKPASTKALEAIRFGGVPIIVKMPPKAMPNASGGSCLEAGSLAAEQMPSTTGIRQAVVPVLDKKTEYRDYFFPDVLRQPGMEHCCTDDEHAGK